MNIDDLQESFVDIYDAKKTAPRWVIQDLIPVGLVVIGGPPKAGKSTWALAIAAMAAGWDCVAFPAYLRQVTKPGPSLILSGEATAGELKDILETCLRVTPKPEGGILIADDPWDFMLNQEGSTFLLKALEHYDPRICILDPFRNFHSCDENDSAEMTRILKPLRKWAVENDAAFCIMHHTTKPPAAERAKWKFSSQDLRGSGAVFASADGVLMITPKSEDDVSFVHVGAQFKRGKSWSSDLQLALWDKSEAREMLTDIDKIILKGVQTSIPVESIAKNLNLSSKILEQSLNRLRREGLIK